MFTTVPSSTTISCAKPTKANAFQRRGSASDEAAGLVEDMREYASPSYCKEMSEW